jgi:hypothetical protein
MMEFRWKDWVGFLLLTPSLFNLLVLTFVLLINTEVYATDKIDTGSIGNGIEKRESFSFVVWGHPRGGSNGVPPLHFEEILERIEQLQVDFLIVAGDVVAGGGQRRAAPPEELDVIRSDWQRFDAGVSRLEIPVHVTPGNHDIHSIPTRDIFLEHYKKPPYAFSFKGSRFILLDTVGVDQQSARSTGNEPPWWDGGGKPFDESQMNFIRSEIEKQDEYQHLFMFMHHVRPWSDSDGFWWRDVHPMLKGGKVRAVFSGTPTENKYLYHNQDGIHYIMSCTVSPRDIHFNRNLLGGRWEADRRRAGLETSPFGVIDEWSIQNQLDSIQHVRVEGDKVKIDTIVVGAWNSPATSPRFWEKVKQASPVPFENRVLRQIGSYRRLLFVAVAFGVACLMTGIILVILWRRYRRRP